MLGQHGLFFWGEVGAGIFFGEEVMTASDFSNCYIQGWDQWTPLAM